ncbi:MAG: endolytic transglycosylase MltG [Melioribacteraceae bacterium]|nr:endolytic transglycosylase MltG [Melioribacteraceae bacterium]
MVGFFTYIFFFPNSYYYNPKVSLDIKQGMNFNEVLDSLKSKGVIQYKLPLKFVAYIYNAETKIKAGKIQIPNTLSNVELVELLLTTTKKTDKLISIGEGIWQNKLAKLFKDSLGIDSSKFMELSRDKTFLKSIGFDGDNIEGYLLPETYYFYVDSSPENIISKLYKAQNSFFNNYVKNKTFTTELTRKEILILASIVDGESNKESEFRTIAGVYLNRLKIGMPLQADPTVQYLVREERGDQLFRSDFKIISDYNTYLKRGMPPSPINNPGKEAILAVINPEKHNFLYFVADGTGGHVFSSSFIQHQINVGRYKAWQRNSK